MMSYTAFKIEILYNDHTDTITFPLGLENYHIRSYLRDIVEEHRIKLELKHPGCHVKVKLYNDYFTRSIYDQREVHSRIKDKGLSPNVIDEGIIAKCKIYHDVDTSNFYIVYLVTQRLGDSLDNIYIPESRRCEFSGPGLSVDSADEFPAQMKTIFPEQWIPDHIVKKVEDVLIKLRDLGVYHEDVHPGNFLQEGDNIFIIDFECSTILGRNKKDKYTHGWY